MIYASKNWNQLKLIIAEPRTTLLNLILHFKKYLQGLAN